MSAVLKPTPQKFRTTRSTTTSTRFLYLVETIAKQNEPTDTQLNALESSYRSTGDYLAECQEFKGLIHQIHAHGSRQLGTIVRPSNSSREGFDIDLIARLDKVSMRKYSENQGPTLLLNHLHTALERYAGRHNLKIHRWDRCVTLEYAGGMNADIAPVIDAPLLHVAYGETHSRIPDRKLRLYDSTNPRGYAKYFDEVAAISPVFSAMESLRITADSVHKSEIVPLPEKDQVFERMLSRLVQLLKLHRNVAFETSSADMSLMPSSIFITSLAAAAYKIKATQPHLDPLDLLLDIVQTMPLIFRREPLGNGREEWFFPNPTAPDDNLASGMNSHERQVAFNAWHTRLLEDIQSLLDAIEENSGVDQIIRKIEAIFGSRAALGFQQAEATKREEQRASGRVAIFTATTPIISKARSHTFFGS